MRSGLAAAVPVRVIEVDLADLRVRVTPQVSNGPAETFASMVSRSRPAVAVNGAYFSKTTLAPIGDIVIEGRKVRSGMMGTALAITRDNRAIIRRVTWGHAEDWTEYATVLACGPALVLNGRVDVQPEREGFRDPHVMGSTRRMGIGLTRDRRLLIVTTLAPVTFRKWAEVMLALGCWDAMNLDAGASLAMHYRGKTLITPGRQLTNLLLVYVDREPLAARRPATDPQASAPADGAASQLPGALK
jgi:exopolysaccharide biosynthesis protein